MLKLVDVFNAQAKYSTSGVVDNSEVISYEVFLQNCRKMLSDRTPLEFYNWEVAKQNDYTENLLLDYVNESLQLVDGFITDSGTLDTMSLLDKLRTDIVDFGVLREAFEDEDIQEIQINDAKTIWVVKGGKSELYHDDMGNPMQFSNDEELHSSINRLIMNPQGTTPRFTRVNPLVNTRTAQYGFRLSGVDSSAITPDSTAGYDFPCTSITIRKYAPSMLMFDDFEDFGTLTPEMSKFLRFCGKANVRLACVGATSSGKTTLLNAIAWEVDPELRIILIQNPTEIMIYDRSPETGANLRNVLHWEAQDITGEMAKDPTTPTMSNMIAHTLRNTPDVIIPGEVRTPEEFYQMNRALKTGHRVLTTWHALDAADAIDRAATELTTLGGSLLDNARSLANSFDIVVSQQKLGDGSRKVVAIEELTGRLIDGKAETRTLFEYKLTGKADVDANGKVKKIHGYFQQVEPMSEKLLQQFYSVGINKEDIIDYINVPSVLEGRSNLSSQVGKEV